MTVRALGKMIQIRLSVKLVVLTFARSLVIVLNKKVNDIFKPCWTEMTFESSVSLNQRCVRKPRSVKETVRRLLSLLSAPYRAGGLIACLTW